MTLMTDGVLYREGKIGLEQVGWAKSIGADVVPTFCALTESLVADVVIVGGGLLGTSLALHLAEKNISVILLEAKQIGFGASGRNAGHVATHVEFGRLPAAIKKLPDGGACYLDLVRTGPAAVAEVIRKHNIACNFSPTGHLALATKESQIQQLEEYRRYWDRQGIAMRLLSREETRHATASPRFVAALRQESGGRINSFAYTNGMAQAATRLGARIFVNSPVEALEPINGRWRVSTAYGDVIARKVFVCTNAYSTKLIPELTSAYYPAVPGVISFKPLPESVHRNVIPSGATISQLGLPAAIQMDVTGRFCFSSTPPFGKAHLKEPFETAMRRWIRMSFPAISASDLQVEAYWTGRTANLPDGLPRIYTPAPGVYAPIACNGLGITTCTQFGIALANAVVRDRYTELPVPLTQPRRFLFRGAFNPVLSLFVSGMTVCGRLQGA